MNYIKEFSEAGLFDLIEVILLAIAPFIAYLIWKRQVKYENYKALYIEAKLQAIICVDAIKFLRNEVSYGSEFTPEQVKKIVDDPYMELSVLVKNRYQKKKEDFDKLRKLTYQMKAIGQEDAAQVLNQILEIPIKIVASANAIGRWSKDIDRYNKMKDLKNVERYLSLREEHEAIVYENYNGAENSDDINDQLNYLLEKFERLDKKIK